MRVVIACLAVAGLAVLGFVYSRDPSEGYGLPPCGLKAATGYHCPGCGGTRAAHALLHGRIAESFFYNPLFVIGLVIGALALAWRKYQNHRGRRSNGMSTQQGIALAVVIIVTIFGFGVIRNLTWYPLLPPPIHVKR